MSSQQQASGLSAEIVLSWFQQHRKPWPDIHACQKISDRIAPWKADLVADFEGDETGKELEGQWPPYWDFAKIGASADELLAHMPHIIETWQSLASPDYGIREVCDDLILLGQILKRRIGNIKYPWGKISRTKSKPKSWHFPAYVFQIAIAEELCSVGIVRSAVGRNSVIVSVIAKALRHNGFGDVELSAISQYLTRRNARLGSANDHKQTAADL